MKTTETAKESKLDLEHVATIGRGKAVHALFKVTTIDYGNGQGEQSHQFGVCGGRVENYAHYSSGGARILNPLTKHEGTLEQVTCKACLKTIEKRELN